MDLFALVDDDFLTAVMELLPVRQGHRFAKLSRQLRRVCTRALERKLQLSPEQAVAFVDAMSGRNVFLSGGAGVGKSYTLRKIVQYLPSDEFAVTASTGCAASIIGATTLHSCVGIGLANANAKVYAKRIRSENKWVFERLRKLKTLIIDEVGMLDGATFDLAGLVTAIVRRDYTADLAANQAPFTRWCNVQLIACGDFMQLPPVKAQQNGWVFESKAWNRLSFRNHILTIVHRQQGDPAFADILGRARLGRSTADDMAYLLANAATEPPEGALQLFAVNKPADELNQQRLNALVQAGATPHKFNAMNYGPPHLLENCPAPDRMWLCAGTRVMCLRNLDQGIVNGSLGTVQGVEVRADAAGKPEGATIKILFDGNPSSDNKPFGYSFHTYDPSRPQSETDRVYKFSVKEGKKEIAYRIQIPLRLAWACSIHKSQGMSLDKVSIDFRRTFSDGQAYTALSRCKYLATAFLKGLLPQHLNMVSAKAMRWYEALEVGQWE